MKRQRQQPDDRRPTILSAAITLARQDGYTRISRDSIAAAAGCSPGLVSHYFNTMVQLRRAIMGEALRVRCPILIAQGLVARDSRAMGADDELRRAAGDVLCT